MLNLSLQNLFSWKYKKLINEQKIIFYSSSNPLCSSGECVQTKHFKYHTFIHMCSLFTWFNLQSKRQKKNIEKRETKTKNEKKPNNNNKNIVLLVLFYIKKIIFCWKTYLEKLSWIVTFLLEFFHVAGYGHAVIKYQRPCRYALVLQTPYFDPKYLAIN